MVRDKCEDCGKEQLTWRERLFGHCVERLPIVRVKRGKAGYQQCLARFPGDPEAHVDGPASLQKLVDKRKRQGWVEGKPWDELATAASRKPDKAAQDREHAASIERAFHKAKAAGFPVPEGEIE